MLSPVFHLMTTHLPFSGYNFHYPFLSPDIKLNVSSSRVHPLYKHVISAHHPTLSFLGLCSLVCPFPQFDQQAAFVRKSLDGSLLLPTVEEMLKEEDDDIKYRCVFHALCCSYFMIPIS